MQDLQVRVAQDSRRWWALAALALSVLVVGLDLFVLSLALPTLAVDLHASTGDLQWFVDAYSLVLAAALLPAGLLGDRIGRKKLLIGALVTFGLASLACAYSSSTGELIAARSVLGLAAAVILPLALAVLPVMFTPAERPRAIAIVGGATFIGYPLGPILGGWLLDNYWWGSVDFWTFACINCQRALPHVEAWYREYARDGFVVVGVHTPEFAFEHVVSNVRAQ